LHVDEIKINSLFLAVNLPVVKYFNIAFVLVLFFQFAVFGQKPAKKGFWNAQLILSEGVSLPFSMLYNEEQGKLTVINDEEHISLEQIEKNDDSIVYEFSAFNTQLVLTSTEKKQISGYFYNKDRKSHPIIPFEATYSGRKVKHKPSKTAYDVSGKWKVSFSSFTPDEYPAIGLFNQAKKGQVTGTFLTETGDYRYLSGNMKGDELTLGSFDGSHAFLFTAKLINSNLSGTFYSGSHWQTNWIAQRDSNFTLANPKEITYLKDGAEIKFTKPDTTGQQVHFPNPEYKGKVVIIQLIGTWCPNCLDETNYFKELHDRYHDSGLEILAVGYEAPEKFEQQAERIRKYAKKKGIPYPILVGGIASKGLASKDFHMLNSISSFPTSIFINRKGEVVQIHTGFNGPGTGEIYTQFMEDTNRLVERLLNE
jgi:thiol-disulfide isomerase/thioredoxin